MKPLSALHYFNNNQKRVLPVFLTVFLSVSLLFIMQVMVDSSFYLTYLVFVEPQAHYSSISARTELIRPELKETVQKWETVDTVIPWIFQHTYVSTVIGETGSKVITVNHGDMLRLMSVFSLSVKSGRLPDPDKNEIALHALVAANKNLKLGDKLGSKINNSESLSGEYTVVGLLEGRSVVSFSPLEYWMTDTKITDPMQYGMILLPKDGAAAELDKQLNYLPYQGVDIRTYDSIQKENKASSVGGKLILNFISLTVIAIVTLCTGFLCYLFFYQRRTEFGILNALGYTRRELLRKAFVEVGSISAAGFAVGLLLSLVACSLLNTCIFVPRGQLLRLWNPEVLYSAVCIPLFVTLFGTVPIWRMLNRLDPIAVIEGMT